MDIAVPNKSLSSELSSQAKAVNHRTSGILIALSNMHIKMWDTENELAMTMPYVRNTINLGENSTICMPFGEHRVIKLSDGSFCAISIELFEEHLDRIARLDRATLLEHRCGRVILR